MRNKPIPELTDRQLRNFWLKIDKRGPDQCWEWTADKVKGGYGRVHLHPFRLFLATRVAYYLATGKQPGPLCVCHTCDIPGCCNPVHLFLGTDADNNRDMRSKGRSRHLRGVSHGMSKLTERQVLEIRASNESQDALAVKYSVSQSSVSIIKLRQTWKHVGSPIQ